MNKVLAAVAVVIGLAGCASEPAQPMARAVALDCAYPAFVDQRPYYGGTMVRHAGKLYRATHDNPGYIPDVSTYYWLEVVPFIEHRRYVEGDVVSYQGRVYRAQHDNPGYLPNVSTHFWVAQNCPR